MPRMLWAGLTVLLMLVLSACHGPLGHGMRHHGDCGNCRKITTADSAPVADAERADVLYACDCGNGCKCNSLSKQPGNCACGKPMRWHHVVKVENDEALLCSCKEGCKCSLDAADPSKCGCGNLVKRVSLKGSGLFFCNCGGSCTCNTVQAAPGDCRCGMPLKQIN
jgi:hypothetical protein